MSHTSDNTDTDYCSMTGALALTFSEILDFIFKSSLLLKV